MIYGKDPITKETIEINEWLSESDDNILLIIDKSAKNVGFSHSDSGKNNEINDKIFLFKKSYLQIPELKLIYKKCVIENGAFMINNTYKTKTTFFNLGFYLGKPILINLKEIISKKINKHRIFKVNFLNNNFQDFINNNALLMSQISLSNKMLLKSSKSLTKAEKIKNLPFNKEVYFDEIISKALFNYSYQWDSPINLYLRLGEDYFTTIIFKKNYLRYGKTIEESIENIKQKILYIDKAFIEVAPRNENDKTFFYRGMQRPFEKLSNIGDKETIGNFISVTGILNIALKFSGVLSGAKCCLYKIMLDKGIPYIDMVNTTKFKGEKELLLPRNLVFELVSIDFIEFGINKLRIPIANIKVHLQYKEQFKITSGCNKFLVGNIVPYSPDYIVNEIKKADKKTIAKDENKKLLNIDTKYEELIENHKIALIGKRCPKGYRIHKPTNMCEFFGQVQGKIKKKSTVKTHTKRPRCKNGTRRNIKTGNCEAN